MGKGKAPQAPDVEKLLQQQTKSNIDTAVATTRLNTPNQVSPFSSTTWTENGTNADGTPKLTQTMSLDPKLQGRLDTLFSSPVTTDFSADRQRVEDALMGRLNTQLGKDRAAQESNLAAQGIKRGSGIYGDAQQEFGTNVNDARTSAILNAGTEQNRLQNLSNSSRSQTINEIMSVLGGGQMQAPQVGVAGTDIVGPTMQNYQQQQQLHQQGQSDMYGGLFGLGGSALGSSGFWTMLAGLSDERLKENIEPVGMEIDGVPVVEWDWKDGSGHATGVIAQELEERHPELVGKHPSGYRVVDYGGLMRLGASTLREAA